jgi:hypothetical protein
MGGDEAWARWTIGRMQGDATHSAGVEAALQRVGRLNPCLVARVDVGALMDTSMQRMVPMPGEEAPRPGPLPPMPVVFSLGVEGRTWKGHASLDLGSLAALAEALDGR